MVSSSAWYCFRQGRKLVSLVYSTAWYCFKQWRKISLSPFSPSMYLNLFFIVVWGKKDTPPPPTPLHLGVCTIHQLTDQLVLWLIDSYQRVGVNDPNCSRTQTPSVFTSLRNYRCQNQFIIPFTHGAGKKFWIRLKFSQFADSRFAQLPRTSFSCFTCRHYLTD